MAAPGIVLILFIGILFPIAGIAQSPVKSDSIEIVPNALPLIQIPEYGQKTRRLINQTEVLMSQDEELNEITEEIDEILVRMDEKNKILGDSSKVFNQDLLNREERELSLLYQQLSQNKNKVQIIIDEQQQKSLDIDLNYKMWQLTMDSIHKTIDHSKSTGEADTNLVNIKSDVENFLASLSTALSDLRIFSKTLEQYLTQIALAENKLNDVSNLIAFHKEKVMNDLWFPESPAIWKVRTDTSKIAKKQEIGKFFESDFNIIKVYLKNQPALPFYILVYFLMILGLILYIRVKANKLFTDFKLELSETKIILKNPLLSALIISWFGLFLFTNFPKELNDLLSIIMLLPLIIILKKLYQEWRWYNIILFSISYLLFFVVFNLDYAYLAQRIILLSANLFALIVLVDLRKQNNTVTGFNKFWKEVLQIIIQIFIFLSFISLAANVLGSIRLAQLLTYACLGTILTIHALKAAVSLSRGFVFLILMGPLIRYSYILKDDGKMVLNKMDGLFRFLGFTSLLIIILDFFNIREEIYHGVIGIINYSFSIRELNISLGNILTFFLTILIATWISNFIRYILEKEVFPRSDLKPGVPNTISLMVKFTFVLMGILLAFAAAGIQLDKLAILMGALGVGIGFGLQNIISNFISGIILAIERPMTIGDNIDIPGASGLVRDIGLRASTVRTWDGSDVVVPNAEFISNKLTNWTLFDRRRRVTIEVRIPFDSDIEAISKLLVETAKEIPEVMKNPSPYLNFKGIGTSAMEINLYCWINDTNNIFSYGTAIRKAVYKALLDAGYDIPLPKQDLKVSTKPENE